VKTALCDSSGSGAPLKPDLDAVYSAGSAPVAPAIVTPPSPCRVRSDALGNEARYQLGIVEDVDRDDVVAGDGEREDRERDVVLVGDDAGCAVDQRRAAIVLAPLELVFQPVATGEGDVTLVSRSTGITSRPKISWVRRWTSKSAVGALNKTLLQPSARH
jgi:hypothetical protein